MNELVLQNAILYPATVTFASIIYSILSQKMIGILFAFGLILFGFVTNKYLKILFKWLAPRFQPFLRPNPPKYGCKIFTNCKSTPLTFGMPSGHSQIAVITAVFWIMYLLNHYQGTWMLYLSISLILAMTVVVCYSRIYIGCHNVLQVVMGSLIGLVLGVLMYQIIDQDRDKIEANNVYIVGSILIVSMGIIFWMVG